MGLCEAARFCSPAISIDRWNIALQVEDIGLFRRKTRVKYDCFWCVIRAMFCLSPLERTKLIVTLRESRKERARLACVVNTSRRTVTEVNQHSRNP